MNHTPWVRVVIVNYNAGPLLAETVAALARQQDGEFEAIIVDNSSTDGSVENLSLPDQRFRLVRAGENLGFAAGSNLGARGAETPWLAMLNPDAIPEEDWLAALKRATRHYSEAVMFGSTQLDAGDPTILDGGGDNFSIYGLAWRGGHRGPVRAVQESVRVFSPCAAAAVYRRDIFDAAGGFAESFFCYMEDVDLGFRLNLRGFEAIQVADARVRHVGSASSGRTSSFTVYHGLRNSVFVVVRCMPFPLILLALPLLVFSQVWIGPRCGGVITRLRALRDGVLALPRLLRERRAIQKASGISWLELSRLVVWNPLRVHRLAIVPLPWKGGGPTTQE